MRNTNIQEPCNCGVSTEIPVSLSIKVAHASVASAQAVKLIEVPEIARAHRFGVTRPPGNFTAKLLQELLLFLSFDPFNE